MTSLLGVAAKAKQRPVYSSLMSALWMLLLLPGVSKAQQSANDQVVRFEIPRQRADKALIEFAEQADLTFIFPVEKARKVTANAVQGEFTPGTAISLLLR